MKIPTKALIAVLIITALTLQTLPVMASSKTTGRTQRQVQRVQQHHDRKMELRASVLGMSSEELRQELKQKSFDKILKDHGFSSRQTFWIALQGKIKDELKNRGVSEDRIEKILARREHRSDNM